MSKRVMASAESKRNSASALVRVRVRVTLTLTRTRTRTRTLTLTLTRYDIYNACNTLWGKELVDLIKSREGRLVVRPDSGDPPVIVCEVRSA